MILGRGLLYVALLLSPVAALGQGGGAAHDPDSVAHLVTLEDSLALHPADPRAAQWLWDAGTLWQRLLPGYVCPQMAPPVPPLAAKYPQYFQRHCCSCESFYTLAHFRELVRRFPGSPLAPEAAYLMTGRRSLGECEGSIACWIERDYGALDAFLRAYPTSGHVAEAVQRVNAVLLSALSFRPRPGELYKFDSSAVRVLIARYDSTAAALPTPAQIDAFKVLSPVWSALHHDSRATALRRAVVQALPAAAASLYARQWDSLVTVLTVPLPPRP